MDRESTTMSIGTLRTRFGADIEFPEYQREPDLWSTDQKQRLIDSILRRFDISSIYFYRRVDDVLECIDGRQRINAIMSFMGVNPESSDNGFKLKIANEITDGLDTGFEPLIGLTYEEILDLANNDLDERKNTASSLVEQITDYKVTTVMLSGATNPEEFNLQFLRLNLGALINVGEKLHAMVGAMREEVFTSPRVGKHPFFDIVRIPTRRYAKELTAAQVLLQVFSLSEEGSEFARARHTDLQRFFKTYSELGPVEVERIEGLSKTLDAINHDTETVAEYLKNRAVTVSLLTLAWSRGLRDNEDLAARFWDFAAEFLGRLRWQVGKMKTFDVDDEYTHLREFQRHLTQASVEKPALAQRHEILQANLNQWLEDGQLVGDAAFTRRTGQLPGRG